MASEHDLWRAGWDAAVGALRLMADEADKDGLARAAANIREAADNLSTAEIVHVPAGTALTKGASDAG